MLLRDSLFFHVNRNSRDLYGKTPLHYAVIKSNVEIVALLLKYSVNTELADVNQHTPLDIAKDMQGPCAVELIDILSVKETTLTIVHSEPTKVVHDTSQSDSSNPRLTIKSTTEDLYDVSPSSQILELALRETGVPIITSPELVLHEVINRGSSCVVIRGRWRGSDVAVKQFKLEYRSSQKDLYKFVAEMRVLSLIRHPNLLLLMGICVDQPNLCLITEYVTNCTLFSAIHRAKGNTPLSLAERFKIAFQLTQGLLYLHINSPPIVHRDLKPENVLLDANLDVKIADFGLARPLTRFRSEEMTTTCIGTTRFMAPELFDKSMSGRIGVEVDIWALGCIFIELFSGKRPWDYISSAKANHIYYEIFHKKPIPIPSVVPGCMKNIITRCCEYNPKARLSCLAILSMLELCKLELAL
jgi:tRNA A-37 threonylcarbamoyl transferase component Bud32